MVDGTCEGCVYNMVTISDDENLIMKCRRYPPVLIVYEGDVTQAFPDAFARCGEYKEEPKPVPENPGRKIWRT